MNSRLAIVTGANGALGACFVKHFVEEEQTQCVAMSRSDLETEALHFKVDLLDAKGVSEAINKIDISEVDDVILVHGVGKFKYEELESVERGEEDVIDDEVFSSNYHTFVNVVNPLVEKLNQEHERDRETTLALCAFGSVTDKYKITFWRSYTYAKDTLREYIKDLAKSEDWKGLIRGRFVNVSTTDTGNENKLRPNVTPEEKQYWLKPEKILDRAIEAIENQAPEWEEIDVYEPMPGFDPESYYSDNEQIKEKWDRQMGLVSS